MFERIFGLITLLLPLIPIGGCLIWYDAVRDDAVDFSLQSRPSYINPVTNYKVEIELQDAISGEPITDAEIKIRDSGLRVSDFCDMVETPQPVVGVTLDETSDGTYTGTVIAESALQLVDIIVEVDGYIGSFQSDVEINMLSRLAPIELVPVDE